MIVSVTKGNRLEYEVVWDLQRTIDPTARRSSKRGVMYKDRNNRVDGDIDTKLPVVIECKFHESLKGFYKHWDQAVEENTSPSRKTTMLVIKSSNRPTLACMEWGDWMELTKYALAAKWPDGVI